MTDSPAEPPMTPELRALWDALPPAWLPSDPRWAAWLREHPEQPEIADDDAEERMADYLLNGTVDGEVFDGDPADIDF